MFLTTETQVKKFFSRIQGAPRIAVDVEFMRERTYFPILALIQVATEDQCAAIDPMEVPSLDPLFQVLHDPGTVKVLHAGGQDLEIFFRASGRSVKNIFDTQFAASLVGLGAQVSLMKLVEAAVGIQLDKSESYSDWTRRPLSEKQVSYALNDVRYLLSSQDYLLRLLKERGRVTWLREEFDRLEDPARYELPLPENQYQKIKGGRSLKPRGLAVLRELAAWREREARRRDRFLNAIIREEALLVLARQAPSTIEKMQHIRGLHPGEIKRNGQAILQAIREGLAVPEDGCPVLPPQESNGLSSGVEGFLWNYVQSRGKKLQINPAYLATRKDIRQLARLYRDGAPHEHPVLKGWRRRLIGKDLLALLEGKATLGIDSRRKALKLIHGKG